MGRRLFTVEDTFLVKGRGIVLTPGIIPEGEEQFRVGDSIVLKRPDGSTLHQRISDLGLVNTSPPRYDIFILLRDLDKEELPVGTEVWSINPSDET